LVVGLEERESLVKREFWERAVAVISGDERAGRITEVISGGSTLRDL
jgi:hypothetical protein